MIGLNQDRGHDHDQNLAAEIVTTITHDIGHDLARVHYLDLAQETGNTGTIPVSLILTGPRSLSLVILIKVFLPVSLIGTTRKLM